VSLIQWTSLFNVQRGKKTASAWLCGGVSAASRLLWISHFSPLVIFSQKGGGFRQYVGTTGFRDLFGYIGEPSPSRFGGYAPFHG